MRPFVESLRRLYNSHNIKETKIKELYQQKTITADEMKYILEKQ